MVFARTGIVVGKLNSGIAKTYQAIVILEPTAEGYQLISDRRNRRLNLVQADIHVAEHAESSAKVEFGSDQPIPPTGYADDHWDDVGCPQADDGHCANQAAGQNDRLHTVELKSGTYPK